MNSELKKFTKIQVILGNDSDFNDEKKCIADNAAQVFIGAIRGFYVWNKRLSHERVINIFKGVDKKNDMLIRWSEFSATDDVKRQLFWS